MFLATVASFAIGFAGFYALYRGLCLLLFRLAHLDAHIRGLDTEEEVGKQVLAEYKRLRWVKETAILLALGPSLLALFLVGAIINNQP